MPITKIVSGGRRERMRAGIRRTALRAFLRWVCNRCSGATRMFATPL